MSDHFLVRARQTLVVISCSFKVGEHGLSQNKGSHNAEPSMGPIPIKHAARALPNKKAMLQKKFGFP
jgi:hypothetical protein